MKLPILVHGVQERDPLTPPPPQNALPVAAAARRSLDGFDQIYRVDGQQPGAEMIVNG